MSKKYDREEDVKNAWITLGLGFFLLGILSPVTRQWLEPLGPSAAWSLVTMAFFIVLIILVNGGVQFLIVKQRDKEGEYEHSDSSEESSTDD